MTTWDRSREKMLALQEAGARASASPQEAVAEADVVITSLLDDASVFGSVVGPDGFMQAMKPGAIHLCVTTISPACSDRLFVEHAQGGSRFVAGPVAGRPDSAASGELTTYLAGDESGVADIAKIAGAYAAKVVPIKGRAGLANSMKLCINYMAISNIELMSEAYAFAEKVGLDKDLLRDFFSEAYARKAMKMYAQKLWADNISGENGFAMVTGLKDVSLMLAASEGAGVQFEIGRIIKRKMMKAIESGLDQADWSAIGHVTRIESGL